MKLPGRTDGESVDTSKNYANDLRRNFEKSKRRILDGTCKELNL